MRKNAAEGALKKRIFDWSLKVARHSAQLSTDRCPLPPLLQLRQRSPIISVFEAPRSRRGRIRRMVSGGAALPSELALVFTGAGIPVLQGYGLTETSPVISVNTLEHNRVEIGRSTACRTRD
jgi:long-chain acyl-CoA synthetase